MRPMSVRQMDALCYESGIEFDPGLVPSELVKVAEVMLARPARDGHSAAQELHEKRVAERRRRRQMPEWFSVQDLVREPWERAVVQAA